MGESGRGGSDDEGGFMSAAGFLDAAQLYGWIGLGVALLFLTIGVGRVDPSARGAYAARALLAPSVVLLWPVVLLRWIQLELRGLSKGEGEG